MYIQKDGTDEPICRAAMEMHTWRTDLWTQWEEERGQTETGKWKHTHHPMQDSQWEFAI